MAFLRRCFNSPATQTGRTLFAEELRGQIRRHISAPSSAAPLNLGRPILRHGRIRGRRCPTWSLGDVSTPFSRILLYYSHRNPRKTLLVPSARAFHCSSLTGVSKFSGLNPRVLRFISLSMNNSPHEKAVGVSRSSNFRSLSSVSNGESDSDAELVREHGGVSGSGFGNDEDECEDGVVIQSRADPEEVDRVCKVIGELFALDRNMEAVLDECGVNLSHDLVVDVLGRFWHARKPAFRFFNWAAQRPGYSHNSTTYNNMMAILGETRQFETMVVLLEEMGEKGLLTIETFRVAIQSFAAAKQRKKAVGIFKLMERYKFKASVETFNFLLDNLGKVKLVEEAQTLFVKLRHRFSPDIQTYSVLLSGWCRVKNLMGMGKIWNDMVDAGFKPDIDTHNIMLEGLLRCQKKSEAIKLLLVMKAKGPSPNACTYTIVIRWLCKKKKMNEAMMYLDEMRDYGCQPDAAVYTCLITGFGNQKQMDTVYVFLKEMKDEGFPPDGRTYNSLIKLMINFKMPDDAVRLYKKMVQSGIEPTIHTYNMMMKLYFQERNDELGCAVWEEMAQKGCCPDDNSYHILIGGLIGQGRSEEACKYLEEMIKKGMKAPPFDCHRFVADFSRAGKPNILEELAQKMKLLGNFEMENFFVRLADITKKRMKGGRFQRLEMQCS